MTEYGPDYIGSNQFADDYRKAMGGSVTDEPNLGLATTRQLLEELQARGETSGVRDGELLAAWSRYQLSILPPALLDYRTVDSR